MKQIRDSYRRTGRLHHAYVVTGERAGTKLALFDFFTKDLNFPTKGNPDFWQEEFNVFKIDDSRTLHEISINRPVRYNQKIFVIFTNSLTKDAQNSLLKILEEPTDDTTFFIVLPSITNLISTLKSRVIIAKHDGLTNSKNTKDKILDAANFLSLGVVKRLETVAKIAKDIKDEKLTKSDAITFMKNIEKVIKDSLKLKNAHNARSGSLLAVEDIEKAISYANDESPSIKVILDHLAVTL